MESVRPGSCSNVIIPQDISCDGKLIPREPLNPKVSMEVPPEKLEACKAYAAMLHNKYPKWSKGRVARKTAEYFKLKLV